MTVEAAERQVIRTTLSSGQIDTYDGSTLAFAGTPVLLDNEQAIADGLVHSTDPRAVIPLYVTESRLGTQRESNPAIGRVKKVRASRQENNRGFFFLINSVDGNDPTNAVRGALVNPTLVNGKTYSISRSFTVQYFDLEHASYRNNSGDALNILAYRGEDWSGGNSLMVGNISSLYIEVEPPSNAITLPGDGPAVTVADPSSAPVAPPTFDSPQEEFVHNAIRALAVVDADGEPVLVPRGELRVGTEYLGVRGGGLILSAGLFDSSDDLDTMCDIIPPAEGSDSIVPYGSQVTRSYLGSSNFTAFYPSRMVNGITTRRSAVADSSAINRLQSRVEAANTRWDDMGGALNNMAVNRAWCSEYEEAVQPLGWPGRGSGNRAHDITVNVEFSYSADSVSSSIDESLRHETDVDTDEVAGFELTSLEFQGTCQMTFTNIDLPWNESNAELMGYDLSDYIDSDMIDRRLPSGYSVYDWSKSDVEESE